MERVRTRVLTQRVQVLLVREGTGSTMALYYNATWARRNGFLCSTVFFERYDTDYRRVLIERRNDGWWKRTK
jgi:hypothetical protein